MPENGLKHNAEMLTENKTLYVEFTTVLALQIFKAAECDFVIWETGMGGRLDATNIVTPAVSVITNIALDHQEQLGDTTSLIAAEKAGIIKPGIPVFYGKLDPDAEQVIIDRARELGSPVYAPEADIPEAWKTCELENGFAQKFTYCGNDITLSLGGSMQRENFRIVHNVLKYLSAKSGFSFTKALDSLSKVVWPCRFQKVDSRTIVDGGHNPDGAVALAHALDEFCPNEKFTVIFAAFGDKSVDETLSILSSSYAVRFIFTRPTPWGREPHKFDDLKRLIPGPIDCLWCDDAICAFQTAENFPERILVCGSLYLAGSILSYLKSPSAACDLVLE